MSKQSGPTTNLNVFPPIQQFPIMQQFNFPYNTSFFHQFMFQTKLNQMCLPLPSQVPNPFHPIPSLVPRINPFAFFDNKQHNLRLQQLQRAFQLGVERERSSSLHEPSISRKDIIDVGCAARSQEPKEINTLKYLSGDSKNLISQWDPWFHRRVRKQINIKKKTLNKSSKKSSLVKIRKTRKEKITLSNKCVKIFSKTQNTQHGNPSTLPTQPIIDNYEELPEPKIGALVGPNGYSFITSHQKDFEIRSI